MELRSTERTIIRRIKRAKWFVCLRRGRHALFDAPFQAELAAVSQDRPKGQPPIPPAQLALATILPASPGGG